MSELDFSALTLLVGQQDGHLSHKKICSSCQRFSCRKQPVWSPCRVVGKLNKKMSVCIRHVFSLAVSFLSAQGRQKLIFLLIVLQRR